jgi:hypothetical protein
MSYAKIKICDVRNEEALQICKDNEVDFIGLHQINSPITKEDINLFQKIVEASGKIKTVLLTQKVPIDEIVNLLQQVPFDYVQLHRTCSINDVIKLKEKVKDETGRKIGVIAVFEADDCDFKKVREMSHFAEFILFDSRYHGGTGIRISMENLKKVAENCKRINYFIAGGLNPDNVEEVLRIAKPYGVDVQTGLESSKHIKDSKKVRAFVQNVRQYQLKK